ncbi:MAG: iron ABC transporter permease [Gemmatimonadaceae bacterium]|nr:iron ABC transporter permease [Gemmatimonadaceae bacterium]
MLVVALLASATMGIAVGAFPLSASDVWGALFGDGDPTAVAVVHTLRLPRVVLGALVGAALGTAGGALQGALRNPLAEPYLLGVSGGAAVGASLAFALGAPFALIPPAAFGGALAAVGLALLISRAGTRSDPRVLLMAGVVVGAFANAAIMVVLADLGSNTVRNALWWMMGSVADANWAQVRWLATYAAITGGLLIAWARQVDLLALGEDAAAGLGLDADRAAPRIYIVASLLAAATVASAGLVGFVGLVVPHLARALGFRHHRAVFVASALAGASLVVLADVLARTVRAPAELPLGAVTALIGVPFFLARIRRLA